MTYDINPVRKYNKTTTTCAHDVISVILDERSIKLYYLFKCL